MQQYPLKGLNAFLRAIIVFWTGCCVASLWWNMEQARKNTLSGAYTSARVAYEKDLVYRRWSAENGGVYVPVSEKSQPNPHLHAAERDILTPSGRKLTLINPAYMTRSVHELQQKAYGVQGHITSLQPIRPENEPDAWERRALQFIKSGKEEVMTIDRLNEKEYFRLMSPLFTEEGCLKCHREQGHTLGDLRGGISVSIPMASLWGLEKAYFIKLILTHLFLCITGVMGISFFGHHLKKQMIRRKDTEGRLRASGTLLEKIFESIHFCIVYLDKDFNFIRVNKAYAKTCGHTPASFIGKNHFELYPHEENEAMFRNVVDSGEPVTVYAKPFEFPDQPHRGTTYWDWTLTPVKDEKKNVEGLIFVLLDVTRAKKAEQGLIRHGDELEKLVEERTRDLQHVNRQLTAEIEERKQSQEEQALSQLRLSSLWNIASMVDADFQTLCGHILTEITAMTRSEYGFYGMISDDNRLIHNFSWSENVMNDCQVKNFPLEIHLSGSGLISEAIRKKKILMINDYDGLSDSAKIPEGHVRIHNVLLVPIAFQHRIITLVAVANKHGDYTDSDVRQIEAFATNVQTIIERQRAMESLVQSEEKYRVLIENTNDLVVRVDRHGIISFVNHMSERFYGVSPRQCVGRQFFEFVHPKDIDRFQTVMTQAIENHETGFTYENRQVNRHGSIFDIFWTVTLYDDEQGRFFGTSAIGRDVTAYKKMHEEFSKINKLKATGVFAGGIAHDFNNLLYIILGNIDLVKEQIVSGGRLYSLLTEAETAVFRARDLTQKFITFSSGGEPIKSVANLTELIEEVSGIVFSGTNIHCDRHYEASLWPVEIDTAQIRQVLANVMENARDAMASGGTIQIKVANTTADIEKETRHVDMPDGTYVSVIISDTGAGISTEDFEHIFDPYFSTKHRGAKKGMGLGLSIVHSVVQKHHGHLHVASMPNRGTDFHIYLPSLAPKAAQGETAFSPLKDRIQRILLMDDEAQIRTLSQKILKKLGYDVVVSAHGSEAIDLYLKAMNAERPFDLVVLDLTIRGGMGGVETFHELRKIDPGVQAIIVSGYGEDPVMSNYSDYGFVASLTKPISMSQFKETFDQLNPGNGQPSEG